MFEKNDSEKCGEMSSPYVGILYWTLLVSRHSERVFEPNQLDGKAISDQIACSVDEIPAKNPYVVDERGIFR